MRVSSSDRWREDFILIERVVDVSQSVYKPPLSRQVVLELLSDIFLKKFHLQHWIKTI